MADDVMGRIEKQMEGTGLALAAVAEVLQKMDYRLTKAEEDGNMVAEEAAYQAELEQAQFEKSDLIKSIAGEVVEMLKAGQYDGDRGVPVDGEKVKSASSEKGGIPSTGTHADADDSEKAVTIDTKTENVQGIIQAMETQLSVLKEGMFGEGDPDDDMEGSEKKPVTDEDENEDEQPNEQFGYKSMEEKMEKMIQQETENRLRKMGFREENSLNSPQVINYDSQTVGLDGTNLIKQEQSGDEVVDQLMQLSYKQLRDLQNSVESGNTDGIPRELLG